MLSSPAPEARPALARRLEKLTSLLDVTKAMAAERDLDLLLPLILREAAGAVEADRCSLFILDRERNELWSKVAQGAKGEIRMPATQGIAGAVVQSGAVINLPDAYADERFNRAFDRINAYRTRTILCVPMRDAHGEVSGVLQALNKRGELPFDAEDEELLLALGAQAAGAVENALLHEEINRLFEGFVSASVVAIEARDPTTAGHSGRVADLTVALAQTLEHVGTGPYARTRFTAADLQELRYASLLHDFGKVGVRERVLVKAEKLYPHELEALRSRFELARMDLTVQSYKRRLHAVRTGGPGVLAGAETGEEARLAREQARLDEALAFILACNRPTVLEQGGFERLGALGGLTFDDSRGATHALLTPHELERLSIPRGSLSEEERREIESHVTHTFRFLGQIPWTRALRRVPEIAYAHHEKLDGSGYPRAMGAADIPVQSRMMAIADIYDALTASDRPYKKAVPHTQALDILGQEAKRRAVDAELLAVFIEADIPRSLRSRSGAA
ncbi:MAG: GAF domain-containing protein [Myxococcaceae bacterium]|nr:GAF domain-containing protein [Myxococcaceae bacterium]MCI0671495.1 GAF domain-containing protein [Myxococcaceae bacterium]